MKTIRGHHFGRAAVFAALLLFVAMAFQMVTLSSAQKAMRQDTLKLITASGTHSFTIEIAEKDEDKARGLMFRRTLAPDAGMLFPYDPPQEITMWMKNTYISLDMVFIRADGVVHRIATGTEPFSEKVIASEGTAAAVLEVIAGTAARIGLKPGDRVEHAMFVRK
jgi:uncharacterized membrane protein (UPF0127 family)